MTQIEDTRFNTFMSAWGEEVTPVKGDPRWRIVYEEDGKFNPYFLGMIIKKGKTAKVVSVEPTKVVVPTQQPAVPTQPPTVPTKIADITSKVEEEETKYGTYEGGFDATKYLDALKRIDPKLVDLAEGRIDAFAFGVKVEAKHIDSPIFFTDLDKILIDYFKGKRADPCGKEYPCEPKGIVSVDEIWQRDDKGLYKMVDDKKVYYNECDAKADHRAATESCPALGLDTKACADMMTALFAGDDKVFADLKAAKISIVDATIDKIKGVHPAVIKKTLQKYGFKIVPTFDEIAKKQLDKIEPFEEWAKRQDKLGDLDENVKGYLEVLIQFVNKNPAILNVDYAGKSEEGVGLFKAPSYISPLNLKLRREPIGLSMAYDLGNLQKFHKYRMTGFRRLPFNMGTDGFTSPFNSPYGKYPQIYPGQIMSYYANQYGGDFGKIPQYTHADTLKAVFLKSLDSLSRSGRALERDDKDKLLADLDKLSTLEHELMKTIDYIDTFNRLKYIFKGYESKILTQDKIKALVEHFDKCDSRHMTLEETLLNTLYAMHKLIEKETPKAEAYKKDIKI